MIRSTIIYIILVLLSLQTFSQWHWYNPLIQGNTLTTAEVIDDQTIIAAGECGTLLLSNDSGQTWEILEKLTSQTLRDIEFYDSKHGVAVGDSGVIIRTNDGGNTWIIAETPTDQNLYAVSFADSSNIVAVGWYSTILGTTDGGNNWHFISSPVVGHYYDIQFPEAKRGFIVGRNSEDKAVILNSADEGTTWSTSLYGTYVFPNTISFINPMVGYAAGYYGLVLKTMDGGTSWELQPDADKWLHKILFINQDTGYATSNIPYSIYRTVDGANSWEDITPENQEYFKTVIQTSQNKLFAFGTGGFIAESGDFGDTWTEISHGLKESFLEIQFTDEQTGFITAGDLLLKSLDGGVSWDTTSISGFSYGNVQASHFCDKNTGFVLGGSGEILRTTDGGSSWSKVLSKMQNRAQFYTDIFMIDKFKGFMTGGGVSPGGSSWSVAYSTNNGIDWQQASWGPGKPINTVHFFDQNHGFALCWEGLLLKTYDGGNNWQQIQLQIDQNLKDMFFVSRDTGYMIASSYSGYQYILKTTDIGQSWNILYQETDPYHDLQFNAIYFATPDHGMVVGNRGLIMVTQDGGVSWKKDGTITGNSLYKAYLKNEDNGMIVGSSGTILIKGSMHQLPEESHSDNSFYCFPNPSSGEVWIDLPDMGLNPMEILVFDISGRLVLRSNIHSGNPVSLDISILDDGVYILELINEKASYCGKVILNK